MIEWKIVISTIIALVIIQTVKFVWATSKKEQTKWKDAFADGGVVSAHCGVVSALCTSLYFDSGFSELFFVSFVFSLIVLRDAVGVRKITRENAHILDKKFKLNRNVKEGHTFREIVLGILVGFGVAVLVFVV